LAEFLNLGGYVPGAVVQNEHLSRWITAGFIWLPAGVCLLLIAVIALYPADAAHEVGFTRGNVAGVVNTEL
jgi:Na+/melibiose symporter-like transporter